MKLSSILISFHTLFLLSTKTGRAAAAAPESNEPTTKNDSNDASNGSLLTQDAPGGAIAGAPTLRSRPSRPKVFFPSSAVAQEVSSPRQRRILSENFTLHCQSFLLLHCSCFISLPFDIKLTSKDLQREQQQDRRVRARDHGTKLLDEPCTALIGEVDLFPMEGDSKRFLACGTPSGMVYRIPAAAPEWVEEMLASGELISGVTDLVLPPSVRVEIPTQTLTLDAPPTLINNPEDSHRKLAVVMGEKSVLVVGVVAQDAMTSFSESELADSVFGHLGDPVNLRSQYADCSYGKLIFDEADSRTGTGSGTSIADGTVTVTLPGIPVSVGDGFMVNVITDTLNAEFGVSSPTELADHVMYWYG